MALDIPRILDVILDRYTLPLNGDHGVGHWARVMENGLRAERSIAKVLFGPAVSIGKGEDGGVKDAWNYVSRLA